jgi:hypothetical protein
MATSEQELIELIRQLVREARADATAHARVYSETALKLCDAVAYLLQLREEAMKK